jgi:hypothetical protein
MSGLESVLVTKENRSQGLSYEKELIDSLQAVEQLTSAIIDPPHHGSDELAGMDFALEGGWQTFTGSDRQVRYVGGKCCDTVIGLRQERSSGQFREFSRLNVGFAEGGISSIASGGAWVFVAGELDHRVVVLRLCHDWYQNRSRLLVMRVLSGGIVPSSLATTKDGSLLCVLDRGESTVRFYACRMNGRLDLISRREVRLTAKSIRMDQGCKNLLVHHGSLGETKLELESIFENIAADATVNA